MRKYKYNFKNLLPWTQQKLPAHPPPQQIELIIKRIIYTELFCIQSM